MAAGTPVVATRVGGVAELLGFGRYGVLVPPADPEALTAALAALAADPMAARRRAAAAQLWVQRFSADRVVPELEACYWPPPAASALPATATAPATASPASARGAAAGSDKAPLLP